MNTVLAALLILFAAAILLSQLINVNRRCMALSMWVSAFVYGAGVGVGRKTINFIAYPFVLLSRHVANVNGGDEDAEDEEVDTKSARCIPVFMSRLFSVSFGDVRLGRLSTCQPAPSGGRAD